jgi:hypothetical protein
MTGFINTYLTITCNHAQLQQLTISGCLRLAPFLTGLRVSSLPLTDLALIYESLTSELRITNAEDDSRLKNHFRIRVGVTLRLAVYRQSVHLGAEPLETHGQNFFSQLNTCSHSPYITCSLTTGSVCHLQLLLALASAFILGSEFRGTRDHILLSQIRDFPFCGLLRLSGLR